MIKVNFCIPKLLKVLVIIYLNFTKFVNSGQIPLKMGSQNKIPLILSSFHLLILVMYFSIQLLIPVFE